MEQPPQAPSTNAAPTISHMAVIVNCMPTSQESSTITTLHFFVKELRTSKAQPEVTALKYLRHYGREVRLQVTLKELQKFLPNVNLKSEKRLISLFGAVLSNSTDPKNPKEVLYDFAPRQYILATMVNSLTFGQFEKRIDFAFKMYDSDDDGKISKADLKEMMSMYGKEGQFKIDDKTIGELVDAIIAEVDDSQDGLISLSEFKSFFEGFKSKEIKFDIFEKRKAANTNTDAVETVIDENDALKTTSRGQPSTARAQRNKSNASFYASVKSRILIDGPQYIWMALWLGGLLYFFISKFIKFYDKTGTFGAAFAKGFAGTISYNMAIMIALITKSLTTILRKIGLVKLLPLNFNVSFHETLGFFVIAAAWGHALCHLTTVMKLFSELPLDTLNSILNVHVDEIHTHTWWVTRSVPGITGLIALSLMSLMVVLAIKKIRHKHFESFWYVHALWLIVIPLLCVHGMKQYLQNQEFYWWVGVPTIVLIFEKLYVLVIYLRGKFEVVRLEYLESGVVELAVKKHAYFKYMPGQYARINIPQVSRLQWHPFSFSSSPDQEVVSFHISPVGDWTNQLKELAANFQAKKLAKSPVVYLEGPYGAPSQHYSSFKHIMIVSSGVGATPFASIMRDLNHKLKGGKPEAAAEGSVDFYWVNRKPTGHVWLSSLFKDLQNDESSKSLIKINMYFTSANTKYDIRSLLLWKGMETLSKQGKKIKGMEHFEMMHWGRPDWDQIFRKKVKQIGHGNVGVFFCGNNFLAEELYKNCLKHTGDVVFRFHKEIF